MLRISPAWSPLEPVHTTSPTRAALPLSTTKSTLTCWLGAFHSYFDEMEAWKYPPSCKARCMPSTALLILASSNCSPSESLLALTNWLSLGWEGAPVDEMEPKK